MKILEGTVTAYSSVISMIFVLSCGSSGASKNNDTALHASTDSNMNTEEENDASADTGSTNNSIDSDTDRTQVSYTWPTGKYIPIEDVYKLVTSLNRQMLLVNVSDEEFYNLGHIENSVKIPWDILGQNLDRVDPDRYIVLYCRRGVRSESAYDTLIAAGYKTVWVMGDGGLEAWIAAGYPTVAN